jgi:uncharacterized phage-associated protein
MATVHDIAAYIIGRTGPTSAMKLQKLVYYSQAWAVTRLGRPLFSELIQAWAHGPVCYELFDLHRGQFVVSRWQKGNPEVLTPDESLLVEGVIKHYGSMSAQELSDLTHREAPWNEARKNVPAGFRSTAEISLPVMREFYSRQPVPPALA